MPSAPPAKSPPMRCAPSRTSEIEKILAKQEEVGLQSATDGEFRRSWWHFDFLAGLDGCELVQLDHGIAFHGVQTKAETVNVVGKVGWPAHHPMIDHFKFLKEHTRLVPKMTIPSPSVLHFRSGFNAIKSIYPDIDEFFADAAAAYGKAIRAFYDAGCRYLQLDDIGVGLSLLGRAARTGQGARRRCRPPAGALRPHHQQGAGIEARRHDHHHACLPRQLPLHLDLVGRLRAGGRDACSPTSIIDGYFLEYDTERAGGFEPLRFLPKGNKMVVLGLITSKSGTLENKDDVKKRIDEATKYVALDQLACRRNAASPRPRRATSSPRRRSGRSSARSSRSPTRSGRASGSARPGARAAEVAAAPASAILAAVAPCPAATSATHCQPCHTSKEPSAMKVCVYGAGAIGGVIAARLALERRRHVGRGARRPSRRDPREGTHLPDAGGQPVVTVAASDDPADLGPQDVVIVGGQGTPDSADRAPDAGAARPRDRRRLCHQRRSLVVFPQGRRTWNDRRLERLDPGGVLWDEVGVDRTIGCVVNLPATVTGARRGPL